LKSQILLVERVCSGAHERSVPLLRLTFVQLVVWLWSTGEDVATRRGVEICSRPTLDAP
jgi:hypothetical protein